MARVVIDRYGTKEYRNETRKLHREDGPARIRRSYKEWYLNGVWQATLYMEPEGEMITQVSHYILYSFPNGAKNWLDDHQKNGIPTWPPL